MNTANYDIPRILKANIGKQKTIELYGVSDWHLGSQYCDRKKLNKFIEHIRITPNAYCLVLGDIMDNALKSSVSNVYAATLNPHAQINEAANILYPIRNKILAICEGNHEVRSVKEVGLLPMNYLTCKLGLDAEKIYSIGAYYLFLNYENELRNNKGATFTIYCKHGKGGGGTVGGKANAMIKAKAEIIADIYISGHTHQQLNFPSTVYVPCTSNAALIEQNCMFVNSGMFLRWGGYAVEGGYAPSPVGSPKIEIWAERENNILRKRIATTIGF